VLAQEFGEAHQDAAALRRAHAVPYLERGARSLHGCVDVLRAALRDECYRLFRRGVDIGRVFARAGRQPFSIDEKVMASEVGFSVHLVLLAISDMAYSRTVD
jgi:hypothetical protein